MKSMMKWHVELSKEISYALRHAPWEYELEMDEAGWVLTEQLLDGLRRKPQWRTVSADTLREVIRLSEKKRFEMKDGKIRAFYGHSIPMRISKEEKRPPAQDEEVLAARAEYKKQYDNFAKQTAEEKQEVLQLGGLKSFPVAVIPSTRPPAVTTWPST